MAKTKSIQPATAFAATASMLKSFRAAKNQLASKLMRPGMAFAPASLALTSAASEDPAENVVGVGIGAKTTQGRDTGELSIKIFVRFKFPDSHLGGKRRLPKQVGGLPTDVEQVGTFRKFQFPNPRQKIRPAQPGSSVGFVHPLMKMAGTFGAVVKDSANALYVLSNNHVLADENRLPLGSPILQPGPLDGGVPPTDAIATLTKFVPLSVTSGNNVDAAIARTSSASIVLRDILHIGPPTGTAAAAIHMPVHKFGRTTSYTAGRIASIDTDVKVTYDIGTLVFEDQIIIVGDNGAFSAAGDSGSLILEKTTQKAVGLLFAGSSSHTIANHIDDVLKSFQVKLA
jgi:S1-C subfamily serine protease